MLGEYTRAAKKIARARQAGQGVAVHIRLAANKTGTKNGTNGGNVVGTGIAGSYAIWALTTGQENDEFVRVGCSETTHTRVPSSAIQRVSVSIYFTVRIGALWGVVQASSLA